MFNIQDSSTDWKRLTCRPKLKLKVPTSTVEVQEGLVAVVDPRQCEVLGLEHEPRLLDHTLVPVLGPGRQPWAAEHNRLVVAVEFGRRIVPQDRLKVESIHRLSDRNPRQCLPKGIMPISSTFSLFGMCFLPCSNKRPKLCRSDMPLRQMHSHHLLFLRQGLLIADRSTAIIIRDILDTCRRFTALVERWGGDVLPELLLESEGPGDGIGHLFDEREKAVMGITESLHELYSDFFRLLVDAQNPSSERDKDSSSGGASFSRTSRATQILQIQNSRVMSRQTSSAGSGAGVSGIGKKGVSKEMSDKAMAVDASMGRHLEQCQFHPLYPAASLL